MLTTIKNYVELIVPENVLLALTGFIVGVTYNGFIGLQDTIMALLSLFGIYSSYIALNAVIDRNIDIINKPHRPIPSNRISGQQALGFSIILYTFSLIAAAFVNDLFFLIAIVAALLTLAYSYPGIELKKRFLLGTLTMGLLYGLIAPLMGWAVNSQPNFPSVLIAFLFMLGLGLSITKDMPDVVGDATYSARTIPIALGYHNTRLLMPALTTFSFLFLFYFALIDRSVMKYIYAVIFLPLFLLALFHYRQQEGNQRMHKIFNVAMGLVAALELFLAWLSLSAH